MYETGAELIKVHRERKKMTQKELSALMNVSSGHIHKIENTPGLAEKQSISFWYRISKFLSIEPYEIWNAVSQNIKYT